MRDILIAASRRLRRIAPWLALLIATAVVGHRPLPLNASKSAVLLAAANAEERWERERSAANGHRAGAALLLAGKSERAAAALAEAMEIETGERDVEAIHHCADVALLTDFSTAMLQRGGDVRATLLAFEAADRAWRVQPNAETAWHRAVAVERIGLSAPGNAPATREPPWIEPLAGDDLAQSVKAWSQRLGAAGRARAKAATSQLAAANAAFEREHIAEARKAFAAAEAELREMRSPLALVARDGWIRCECSEAAPRCLRDIDALRTEVAASGRYPWLEARVDWDEGQTYYRRGRMYEAVEWLQRALDQFARIGDAASQTVMHSLLANAYAGAGETDLALAHHLEAIRSSWQESAKRQRRMIDDALFFFLRHGFLSTAGLLIDQESRIPSTPESLVREERYRGILAAKLGDADAQTHFARAAALLDSIEEPSIRANERTNLAMAEAAAREATPARVLADIDQAIAEHQQIDNSVWLPQLLLERAEALESRGDLADAEIDYRRAVDILEQREPRIDQAMIALGSAAGAESPFDGLIRLLLRENRAADALAIAERASALRISSLSAQGAGVRDVFRVAHETPSTDPVEALRQRLTGDDVAVEYYVLRDEVITWIVTRRELAVVRHGARRQAVISAAERMRDCARRACRDGSASTALSRLLLDDWIGRVAPDAALLIVPSPELQNVPFAMLPAPSGFLVERNAVATAPSLGAFERAMREDAARAGTVSAFFAAAPAPGGSLPPLPDAGSEASASSRLYARAAVDTNSTRAAFLACAPAFSLIHFAGHVLVNEAQPLLSALAFDGDELLYVHELDRRSFARARLVVLSGCSSGRSPRPTTSVANALLGQDVPSVVYTLWPVTDDVAAEFAIAFHRAIAAGATRADAVRQAQLQLLRMHRDHPRDWAGFGIAGACGRLTGLRGE